MGTGAITSHIDVAQIVLYAFWIFFAGLIIYIRKEDKREGYPLESDRSGAIKVQGFPAMPEPKSYKLPHGGTVLKPNPAEATAAAARILAEPVEMWPGAPLQPTGNPMLDGVGPGAYANRADSPDLTLEGEPKILPLRVAADFGIASAGPDPRGMDVVGGDGVVAGVVTDAWVDRAEPQVRYLEVEVAGSKRHVLVPMGFSKVDSYRSRVVVRSIMAAQFEQVPALRNPNQITMLEEDRVSAYYGAGTLYAEPSRMGPWL
jgi:photosynthetic reaction center H subunit